MTIADSCKNHTWQEDSSHCLIVCHRQSLEAWVWHTFAEHQHLGEISAMRFHVLRMSFLTTESKSEDL